MRPIPADEPASVHKNAPLDPAGRVQLTVPQTLPRQRQAVREPANPLRDGDDLPLAAHLREEAIQRSAENALLALHVEQMLLPRHAARLDLHNPRAVGPLRGLKRLVDVSARRQPRHA